MSHTEVRWSGKHSVKGLEVEELDKIDYAKERREDAEDRKVKWLKK